MKLLALLATVWFVTPALQAQEAKAEFPKAGFSITPLDAAPGSAASQLIAQFLLPVEGGFAANVNVMVFTGHKDMKGFADITRKEFEQMKATILSEKQPDANTWLIDYTAKQKDTVIRFYARGELKGAHLYLATATCLSDQWEKHGPALKASVDSMKLK
jgi:hypothetical protein